MGHETRGAEEVAYEGWALSKFKRFPEGFHLTESDAQLLHAAIGQVTEAAELLDLVKKVLILGQEVTPTMRQKFLLELGDARYYQSMLVVALHTTLSQVEEMNREKLNARYKEGFTVEESKRRNDEVVDPVEAAARQVETLLATPMATPEFLEGVRRAAARLRARNGPPTTLDAVQTPKRNESPGVVHLRPDGKECVYLGLPGRVCLRCGALCPSGKPSPLE